MGVARRGAGVGVADRVVLDRDAVTGPCSVDGCERDAKTRGLCNGHYLRLLRYGDASYRPRRPSLRERFNRFTVRPDDPDACWGWAGSIDPRHGYAKIGGEGRRTRQAHRVSHELHIGPIPDGLVIDHLCRNRSCTNPRHLEAVTTAVNNSRAPRRGQNSDKTHCVHGHEFTPENTWTNPKTGWRTCKACHERRRRIYVSQGRVA